MRIADFDYALPPSSIAQEAIEPRDHARLMRVPRAEGAPTDHVFHELPRLLRPGDLLVVNRSRVFPARLLGRREGGGGAEVFLLRDGGGGQRVVEVRDAHAAASAAEARGGSRAQNSFFWFWPGPPSGRARAKCS